MAVKWTEEQNKVIHLGNRNILVSAAAGSGKTAVLVERIIQMLTRAENPVDVDKLLVVTFTEAAAAEMKDRIRAAIEKKVEEEPDNENLRHQATLIHSAHITTIHSFCLSVLREHFYVLDIDPGFRIGEEGELSLLKQDVLEEVLEEHYAEGNERFLRLVDSYGTGKSDKKIEEIILRLYEFSRSYPNPEKWMERCVKSYEAKTEEELEQTELYQCVKRNVTYYLDGAWQLLQMAKRLCTCDDGPYMYEDMIDSDLRLLNELEGSGSYAQFYERFADFKWMKLAANRDKTVSSDKAERVKALREDVKGIVKGVKEYYFEEEPERVLQDLAVCVPMMEEFAELVSHFSRAYEEAKRSRNMIDFDDMQQYALRILAKEEGDTFVPTAVAKEYQKQFAEVMIDEYQDSNLIQETILTSVSRVHNGIYNIFMVGDVKQSIYRFRLSRPELFMEKYDTYSQSDSEKQRIDLRKNFRSRKEVLDGVNYLFRQIMKRSLGGVEYDDDAALYVGADYVENTGNIAELILVDKEDAVTDKGKVLTDREKEGLTIATRIKELMNEQLVVDKETGKLRPVRYKDIVILTRSIKGYADQFAEVLKKAGIPVYAGSREGYFETQEIGILLDYLRVLNNRRQDYPLAAVLKSCFCGITDEELAFIKGSFKEQRFYDAVWSYMEEGENEKLKGKLRVFFNELEKFRKMSKYMALHELLECIMDDTGYLDYMRAFPGGEQKEANLFMLLEKARSFENTSYKGVFHFIRYVEQLKKYEIDYGEANVLGEQSDTVRIMSIHKSKGLEFPVVIVAGMGKKFNRQDIHSNVVMHASYGVGLECVHLDERTKEPSFPKQIIAREEYLESTGEELRVLYVALTRAKEKLIMTGMVGKPEEKLEAVKINGLSGGEDESLSFALLSRASSYMDWLLPALGQEIPGQPVEIRVVHAEDLQEENVGEAADAMFHKKKLEQWDVEKEYDASMKANLSEQFDYEYPYANLEGKKLKYSVSELKKRAYPKDEDGEEMFQEEEVIPLVPKFKQQEETISGASRGTAYHRIMELLDFTKFYSLEDVQEFIRQAEEIGQIQPEVAKFVKDWDILMFLKSDSGKRMQKAARQKQLYKEQPFVLGIPMEEVYPGEGLSGETVLIQGIIDVYFEEDGELVVLDYKTDRVKSGKDLLELYRAQLNYYGRALEQITGKKVKEKIIYSFTLREEIKWS